tara:strand:- start:2166 stop:3677 length:1512 start_codon:yes stop_codon:yes gene_type:complete
MAKPFSNLLKLIGVAIVAMALLGGLAYQLDRLEVVSLWGDFLGGFHPVVLHLPIGIVIAIALQTVWRRWRGTSTEGEDRLLWVLAAVTATVSFGTGYLLVMGGGYQSEHLTWHLWGAAIFSSLCWVGLAASCWETARWARDMITGGVIGAVSVTGHYGGLMVHGDPFAGAPWLNDPQRFAKFGEFGPEVRVYDEIVVPILGAKCVACHGPAKQNGRLRLDSFEAIVAGGEHGAVLFPGDLERSSIITFISLPDSHNDHMPPPNRPQITPPELAGLEYWVSSGAELDQVVSGEEPPAELAALMVPIYRLLEDPDALEAREAQEAEEAEQRVINRERLAADLAALPEHQRLGFSFEDLESDRLHFSPATYRHLLTTEDLESLLPLLQASVKVDVSGLPVSESLLRVLAESSQLNELDLSETSVGNEVFAILGKTPGLQRLNLFGTAVDVNAEITPGSFANLRQLFVANTAADVAALDVALPHVDVIGDLGLAPPEAVEEEDQSSD